MKREESVSFDAHDYDQRYRDGYGVAYPESHIIRIHKLILEPELGISGGSVFDFGCGTGAHLRYFAAHSFVPFGCDTSATAIGRCRASMPEFRDHFFVTPVHPDLKSLRPDCTVDVFLANQVLYYLEDDAIRRTVAQAYELIRPGGVFIATMMSYSCWYARHITGEVGDFKRVELTTTRQPPVTLVNFKTRESLSDLFQPFRKLHIGSYGSWIREEEGSTDHWIFVGVRD